MMVFGLNSDFFSNISIYIRNDTSCFSGTSNQNRSGRVKAIIRMRVDRYVYL